jgi:hypothetical protein
MDNEIKKTNYKKDILLNKVPLTDDQASLNFREDIVNNKKKSTKSGFAKAKLSKGTLLEYRMKRLLFYMGYYSKVGVLLKTEQDSAADTITDLDVIGIYVHKDFRLNSVWVDCKAGNAKPLERISWINGVKSISWVDEAIFVKDRVRTSTRNFARKHDIKILETKMIDELEKNFNIVPDDWRGSWDPENQYNQIITLQKIGIPEVESYKRISNYISCDYWTYDKYSKVKKTITALRQLVETEEFPLNEIQKFAIKWAIFELVSMFTLALFEICREVYFFNEKDKYSTIVEGLLSGEISLNNRNKIVDATYRTAYSIIKQHVPDFRGRIEIPSLGMTPPAYTSSFFDLVCRITNDPLEYYDILRMFDFMFMEYDLKARDLDINEMRKLFPNYDNMVVSGKTILHFLSNTTGLKKNILGLFK